MTYYHPTKAAALEAASEFEGAGFDIRASFESYNGWVIILTPLTMAVFDQPLGPLLERAEIDLTRYALLARKPAEYKRPPPVEVQPARRPSPPPPPPRGLGGSMAAAGADTRPPPPPAPPKPPLPPKPSARAPSG